MFQEEAPADGRRAQVGLGFRETGMDQGTFRGFFLEDILNAIVEKCAPAAISGDCFVYSQARARPDIPRKATSFSWSTSRVPLQGGSQNDLCVPRR